MNHSHKMEEIRKWIKSIVLVIVMPKDQETCMGVSRSAVIEIREAAPIKSTLSRIG